MEENQPEKRLRGQLSGAVDRKRQSDIRAPVRR